MLFLSSILKRVVYPSLARVGYLRRSRARQISIITYHGVFPKGYPVVGPNLGPNLGPNFDPILDGTLLTVEMFRRQLRKLRSTYNIFSPSEFRDWLSTGRELPERTALLTCDDGLLNHLTGMVPVLLEENLSCLFFVTGASVADPYSILWYVELSLMLARSTRRELELLLDGKRIKIPLIDPLAKRIAWLQLVQQLSTVDGNSRKNLLSEMRENLGLQPGWNSIYLEDPVLRDRFCVMGVPELQRVLESGMEVGAHTVTHPIPSRQPADVLLAEMVASRELLGKALGSPVWAFAYPFGDDDSVSPREIEIAEHAGFECAFRNTGGPLRSRVRPQALPRIHVSYDMNLGEFEAHVSGFHEALRNRFRGKARSI